MDTKTHDLIVKVTPQMVCDQITTAFEGGSNYWAQEVKKVSGHERATESPWYADVKVFEGPFEIIIVDDDGGEHVVNQEKIKIGLQWLADNHLWRIDQIIKESGDAETADVFLQACALGEIVYG